MLRSRRLSSIATYSGYLLLLWLAYNHQQPCIPCDSNTPPKALIKGEGTHIWHPDSINSAVPSVEVAASGADLQDKEDEKSTQAQEFQSQSSEKVVETKKSEQKVRPQWPLVGAPKVDADPPPPPTVQIDNPDQAWPKIQAPGSDADGASAAKAQIDDQDQAWPKISAPENKVISPLPSIPEMGHVEHQWPRVQLPSSNNAQQNEPAKPEWPVVSAPKQNPDSNNEEWPKVKVVDERRGGQKKPQLPALRIGDLVMVTGSSGTGGFLGVPGLKEQVYENRKAYAERWGHEFMWADMSTYEHHQIHWNKIPIMKEAQKRFPMAKWFWWLDVDAIIMNINIDLYSHILSRAGMERNLIYDTDIPATAGNNLGIKTHSVLDPEYVSCLITYDDWGLNTGSFFFKKSEWTDLVLDMWSDPLLMQQGWVFPEQDGFIHIFSHHEVIRKRTGIVRQTSINAYSEYNVLGSHWQPGDLLVHFPGCGSTDNFTSCGLQWQEYWNMREPYEEYDYIREQVEAGTAPIENVRSGVFEDP